mmetsp:Transcript_81341/g.143533  ORF Transcript_81341/g.143533 Transcript_81341/m.143533 type:complete len:358 (+) Transcript_81341:13-1086(+)
MSLVQGSDPDLEDVAGSKLDSEEPGEAGSKGIAVSLVALSAFAFSMTSLFFSEISYKADERDDFKYEAVVLLRFVIPWLACHVILLFSGVQPWGQFTEKGVLVRSLMNISACILEVTTLQQLTLVDATIIMFTHPFFAAMLSAAVLGEQWSWLKSGLLLLGFAGVVLICNPWESVSIRSPWTRSGGVACGLLFSINVAGMNVWTRTWTSDTNVFLLIHHYLACGVLVLACKFAICHGTDSFQLISSTFSSNWADILGLTTCVVIGELACTKGFQLTDVGILSGVRNLDIIFVMIWQTLLLGQPLSALNIVGAACLFTSTLLLVLPWLLWPPANTEDPKHVLLEDTTRVPAKDQMQDE